MYSFFFISVELRGTVFTYICGPKIISLSDSRVVNTLGVASLVDVIRLKLAAFFKKQDTVYVLDKSSFY